MKIHSNIAGVIRQTERLMANLPVAMERALAPSQWQTEATQMAQTILLTLAEPQERRFVPGFIATLKAAVFAGAGASGLSLTMATPFPELRDILGQAQAARSAASVDDRGLGLFDLPLREFEDLILKWVETSETDGGKKRDSRDAGKSDEDIARLISYIMLSPQIGLKGKVAREKLAPHIAEFLARSQADRLDAAKVDLWLRAVLDGWRELFRIQYPGKVRAELVALKGELV